MQYEALVRKRPDNSAKITVVVKVGQEVAVTGEVATIDEATELLNQTLHAIEDGGCATYERSTKGN